MTSIRGIITRKSNGSIEIQLADAASFNSLPEMGEHVDLARSATAPEQGASAAGAPAGTRVTTAAPNAAEAPAVSTDGTDRRRKT
jgi:hypothetical protein